MSDAVPTPEELTIHELLDQPWIDLRDPSTLARVSDSLAHTARPAATRELVPASDGGRPLARRR